MHVWAKAQKGFIMATATVSAPAQNANANKSYEFNEGPQVREVFVPDVVSVKDDMPSAAEMRLALAKAITTGKTDDVDAIAQQWQLAAQSAIAAHEEFKKFNPSASYRCRSGNDYNASRAVGLILGEDSKIRTADRKEIVR